MSWLICQRGRQAVCLVAHKLQPVCECMWDWRLEVQQQVSAREFVDGNVGNSLTTTGWVDLGLLSLGCFFCVYIYTYLYLRICLYSTLTFMSVISGSNSDIVLIKSPVPHSKQKDPHHHCLLSSKCLGHITFSIMCTCAACIYNHKCVFFFCSCQGKAELRDEGRRYIYCMYVFYERDA